MPTFDFCDVLYLTDNLTVPQLRREIHHAEASARVAEQIDGDLFPYRDFIWACRQAIKDMQQAAAKRQPKPLPGRVDVATIKERVDIVAIVERYTQLRKSGSRFMGKCPLHEDKHPSLTVYPENQSWHCYQCGKGGDVFSFIQAVEHTDFKGAAAILGG